MYSMVAHQILRRSCQFNSYFSTQALTLPLKGKSEFTLIDALIRNPLKPFTKVCAREWYPVPGCSHCGKGDLVLKHPSRNQYLVVEAKYLSRKTGRSARKLRKAKMRKVEEQAEKYGQLWSKNYPDADVQSASLVQDPKHEYSILHMIWKNNNNQDWYELKL